MATLLCSFGLSLSALAGQNIFYYYSDPGDYIGAGAEVTFTSTDGNFYASPYGNGVEVWFATPTYSHWWYAMLNPPPGAVLQPGAYENAQRFNFYGGPGLDVFGDGRGCNTVTGRFDVLEMETDVAGNYTKFAANFEQHCEGMTPAMWGQVRFNSDIPLSGKPVHITLENPLNSQRCVEATSANGATVNVDALGVTDALGGNALIFDWTATTGASSSGSAFSFVAPLTSVGGQPTGVTLTVTDLTNNIQKSVSKSVCVTDTTPPVIVINRPLPGEALQAEKVILDVSIRDAVDPNVSKYEVQAGSDFYSDINPATGVARQRVFEAPKPDGSITATITVRATDATGNAGQASVTFTELPPK
jgi:hypothetical protein